ncbi:metallophosphoesterase family protein [Thiomicrorhabdus chilensis]|uniref:metallophosphoesterase family protein n=1 Tax=Thiomicrorhabdus chilensis TaxID=63656 RepID=UPI0003FDE579|nr:metallophosphoesterase [Thiomicrorhabdus chilensis]
MKIVHLSDTHGWHKDSKCEEWLEEIAKEHQPQVVIHSGDFMRHSMSSRDLNDFLDWFEELPFEHKILVPGNHDRFCEQFETDKDFRYMVIPDEVHLLINESIEINGVKFWGSPYTPEFHNWGFQLDKGEELEHWNKIPVDADVLITHGPAKFILDDKYAEFSIGRKRRKESSEFYESALGCPFLAERIKELNKLQAHLFGHIHGGYGRDDSHGYVALNSSLMNEDYSLKNQPQVVSVKSKDKL